MTGESGKNRDDMAKICFASNLLLLWVDPRISAGFYQVPPLFTDAIAMNVPVIANNTLDFDDMGQKDCIRLVDFEDQDTLNKTIKNIFEYGSEHMIKAARELFLRQYPYRSARTNFSAMIDTFLRQRIGTLSAAKAFANCFGKFHQALISLPFRDSK